LFAKDSGTFGFGVAADGMEVDPNFVTATFRIPAVDLDLRHDSLAVASASANLDAAMKKLRHCPLCNSSDASAHDIYHQLPDESWFRLLVIGPGEQGAPIVCQLHCAQMSDMVGCYETLSYTWHEYAPLPWGFNPFILCNRHSVPVLGNL
jgi:hypothetical protein